MSATEQQVQQQVQQQVEGEGGELEKKVVTPPEGEGGEPKAGEGATSPAAKEGEGEGEGEQRPTQQKDPWYNRRIGQLTREKHEKDRLLQQQQEENRRLREQLAAGQRSGGAAPGDDEGGGEQTPRPAVPAQPVVQQPQGDAVMRAAAELVQQNEFNRKCNQVFDVGSSDERTPNFKQAVDNFGMLGGLGSHTGFLNMALDMEGGHLVLHHLGNNLEEAQNILSLPPGRQAVELAKLQMKLNVTPKKVSGVPAPAKPLTSPAPVSQVAGPDDEGKFKDQESYRAWRTKTFKKR